MSDERPGTEIPRGARPFVAFASLLRGHGFAVVTDQAIGFLRSIGLLGPRSLSDVYWAARATLAPPADRIGEFDGLFDAFFRDQSGLAVVAVSTPEEDAPASQRSAAGLEPAVAEKANESGLAASAAEALSIKRFAMAARDDRLGRMRRRLGAQVPRRRGFRRTDGRSGDRLDFRRSMARLIRGDSGAPAWSRRQQRLRRVLLLVDISGSMKTHTDDTLRFAHALTQTLPRVETFTFGTRLTRVTKSLGHSHVDRALGKIAPAVADWSGGTRIGESIAAFLAAPRYSRAARGALVVVLSDGLERGDAALMKKSVRRLAARSWRLAWLTPLAADANFSPDTAGLKAVLPIIDHLGDGSGVGPLCDFIEASAALGAALPSAGRSGERDHGYRRRPPSHLAAGRPAVAGRADAAAHLRPL